MLRSFELINYRPAMNGQPHYVIAERNDTGQFEGITTEGGKAVWSNADDAAHMRDGIEKEHGLDLFILKMHTDGENEEISWPKGVSHLRGAIITPGAGTW